MTKVMIKATNNNATTYLVCPEKNAQALIELLDEVETAYEIYSVSEMPLEALPEDIQIKAKGILRAFDEVNVTYEYGEFRVSTSICLKSSYNYDHFVCGRYKAEEVYTEEERRQNYIEEFGYAPCR